MSNDRSAPPPATGRIDVHSHLLPGIDDGCESIEESIECVRRLKKAGFVGTICTPHVWPSMFPDNIPMNITAWVDDLQRAINNHGIDYHVWSGGEVRIDRDTVKWLAAIGVPTLADSNCVLFDLWEPKWPRHLVATVQWMLDQGYQPILAHPERMACVAANFEPLRDLEEMGVWLQGNMRSLTGEEGYHADYIVRDLLRGDRYDILALDMHRPESLESRLDGIALLEEEFGSDIVERMLSDAPRKLIFKSA